MEHPHRIAALEHLVGSLVVERNVLHGDSGCGIESAHVAYRPVEDGERCQAEKVELDQSHVLDVVLVELRHRSVGPGLRVERAEVRELARRDQHAAGVHADVARKSLELLGKREQLAHFLLGRLALVQLRLDIAGVDDVGMRLARTWRTALERDRTPGLERDQLGNAVAKAVRQVEHATHVAHHGARLQRAEGGDLRYRFRAVFLLHVLDDLVAAVLAEVDVEVGHRHPLGIQEPLEQERVAQRIEIGDAECVRNQRSRARAAPWADRNTVSFCPVDEVGHDQEVAGVTHLNDRLRFELEPREVLRAPCIALGRLWVEHREALLQPGDRFVAQVLLDRDSGGDRKVGQVIPAERDRQIAPLRNGHGVGQRTGQIGKALRHRLLRHEVLLRGETLGPALIGKRVAFGDADPRLVRAELFSGEKLDRVRGDDRQIELGSETHRGSGDSVVVGVACALDFEVIALRE